jgi:hypothetical protein
MGSAPTRFCSECRIRFERDMIGLLVEVDPV